MTMRGFLLTLAAAVMLLTAACSSTPSETSRGEASEGDSVRMAVLPTVECLPFYVAAAQGLFDSAGVNVRLCTYSAAMDADTAFCGSSADGCVTDLVKAVLWRSRGDSIKVVAAADLNLYLMTARLARIKTPESVKDKIIGITRNSAVDMTADRILEAARLKSDELNRPQINAIGLRGQMIDQNQYDGAILPEPYATMSELKGAVRVTGTPRLHRLNPMAALVFRESFIRQHRQDIDGIIRAYNQAVEHINRLPRKQAARLIALLPAEAELPDSAFTLPVFAHASLPSDSVITGVRQWLRGRSLTQDEVSRQQLTDTTFL